MLRDDRLSPIPAALPPCLNERERRSFAATEAAAAGFQAGHGSIQSCGVHYAANATTSSPFVRRKRG